MQARRGAIAEFAPYLAMLAAWAAMSGSLYFSEVLRWPPCTLCWVQRGFMYPQALVIPVGIYLRWKFLPRFSIIMSLLGGAVSLYHHALIAFPSIMPPSPCSPTSPPCAFDFLQAYTHLDWLSIPLLALTASVIIIASMTVFARAGGWQEDAEAAEG